MIDIEELRITAELARINMSEEELGGIFGAFEQMVEYFQAMQDAEKLPAYSAAPAYAPEKELSAAVSREKSAGASELIVANAAENDGKFIVIPNVL